jgi:hypothetical protein
MEAGMEVLLSNLLVGKPQPRQQTRTARDHTFSGPNSMTLFPSASNQPKGK